MKQPAQTPEPIGAESSGHAATARPSAQRRLTVAAGYFITGWLGLQISMIDQTRLNALFEVAPEFELAMEKLT